MRKGLASAALVAALTIVAAACGGNDDEPSGTVPTEAPATTAAQAKETGGTTVAVASGRLGDIQVTYDGRPLYYFAGDAKPGDTNGQGVGDAWFAVTGDGQLVKEKAAGGSYP